MTDKSLQNDILQYLKSWRLVWVITTLAVFAGLIKLSLWQYQRSDEKQQRLERIEQLSQQQQIPLARVINQVNLDNGASFDEFNDVKVQIQGRFVDTYAVLLDNQVDNGAVGYRVFSEFFDRVSQQHVLLNLGWIKAPATRAQLPDISLPQGEYTLSAHIRNQQAGIVLKAQDFSDVTWPLRVQQIDSKALSDVTSLTLLPFSLYLDESEALGYKKRWQPIVMGPEKHLGYALQWAALAIAWLTLMLVTSIGVYRRKQLNRQNNN